MEKPIFQHFLGTEWYPILKDIFEGNVFHQIGVSIMRERGTGKDIVPPHNKIHLSFRAFRECPPDKLKVIILGQDPYPQPGVFDGLAFSNGNLKTGGKISPSLRSIFDEINRDIYEQKDRPHDPDLTRWANQGVLLLNTALTVEHMNPGSHVKLWEPFMKELIGRLTEYNTGLIFMLWGRHAQQYEHYVQNKLTQHIITAGHPSPLNRTNLFYGSGVFSKANKFIEEVNGKEFAITW